MLTTGLLDRFRVEPARQFRLNDHDPAWCGTDVNIHLASESLEV